MSGFYCVNLSPTSWLLGLNHASMAFLLAIINLAFISSVSPFPNLASLQFLHHRIPLSLR